MSTKTAGHKFEQFEVRAGTTCFHIRAASGKYVAKTYGDDLEAQAVAHLLASAPDLLAALEGLLAECAKYGSFAEVGFHHPMVEPAFEAARAALAKAKGGAQ